MLTLEKYKGSGSRHTCPACRRAKKFTRYIDTETGRYIADHVGRCDRESSCGYHYKPKEHFAANPGLSLGNEFYPFFRTFRTKKTMDSPFGILRKSDSQKLTKLNTGVALGNFTKPYFPKPDHIEKRHLIETLSNYQRNGFVQFLLGHFPCDPEDVWQAAREYLIGTKDGFTVFPTITKTGKVCKAKLMKFDPATGKRLKEDYAISSLQSMLKKAGDLKEDFETDKDVFFGEHLLTRYPNLPIAIVEAEKTTVIACICKGVFPDMVWLAAGSKQWLKVERLKKLGRERTIILYPDADGFELWQSIASDARKSGFAVNVSNLIEKRATDAAKREQVDLADYLIELQRQRNDPANREAFRDLIEERLAIMTIDGDLTLEQAEAEIESSGFYPNAIRSCLGASRELRNVVHPIANTGGCGFGKKDRPNTASYRHDLEPKRFASNSQRR